MRASCGCCNKTPQTRGSEQLHVSLPSGLKPSCSLPPAARGARGPFPSSSGGAAFLAPWPALQPQLVFSLLLASVPRPPFMDPREVLASWPREQAA